MKSSDRFGRAVGAAVLMLSLVVSPVFQAAQTFAREIPAGAQTVPAGTVLILELETRLDSKTTRPSDRFTARVVEPVRDEKRRTLIPTDSIVHGVVKSVVRAQSRRRSGIIEVTFDRLTLPGKREYPINGTLTSASTKERHRIDEEGAIKPRPGLKRHVVFVGAGAGSGAAVGIITGSAILGAGIGAGVGAAAAWLSKGKEAVVEEGTRIGVELNQPLQLSAAKRTTQPVTAAKKQEPPKPEPKKTEPVRPAPAKSEPQKTTMPEPPKPKPQPKPQPAEPDPNPPVEPGANNPPQNQQSADTLVRVSNFQIQRGTDGSVGLIITAETSTSGWKLRTKHATDRDLLEIWLYGDRPKGMAAQVISYPAITLTVPDAAQVLRRVVIHGANGNFSGTVPVK
ncbi:MAG TPA: TrbI/VirB10 family protein [Blastocatellia bacterium]|nr:TrbI/VirB10 family protein [Blastocatellia bacterium]